MPGAFLRKTKEYIDSGKTVKLVFYVGDSAGQASDNDVYVYIGKIKYVDDDLLIFEHIKTESDRMQLMEESLDISSIRIWSISEMKEGFDPSVFVTCPHCKGTISLLSVENETYK